jgi:hypothetical protein
MNAEQSSRLALAFARETARSPTGRLCTACVEVLAVTGAGIRDAFHSGVSVHAPRLGIDASTRWPSFVALAKESGVGAVFAYPMIATGARVGVLTRYQAAEGDLTQAQLPNDQQHETEQ